MGEQDSDKKGTGGNFYPREAKAHSRRFFLKEALVCTIGGTLIAEGLLDCLTTRPKRLAFAGPVSDKIKLPQQSMGHIARLSLDESACASCGLCSLVCAAVHGEEVGPSRAGIWLDRKPFDCEYLTLTCRHCDAPECYYACDAGALQIDKKTGARAIDGEKCVGCKQCIAACVLDPPRIQWDEESATAFKCDLCSGRPEGPACVEFCPRQALVLTKETGE